MDIEFVSLGSGENVVLPGLHVGRKHKHKHKHSHKDVYTCDNHKVTYASAEA